HTVTFTLKPPNISFLNYTKDIQCPTTTNFARPCKEQSKTSFLSVTTKVHPRSLLKL
ncbi:hypothetical protein COCCADRAFT_110677, partial [Bipolaris zeicola 26-R-13]